MPPGARLAACCFALATVALGKQQAHAPALAKVKRDAAASPYFLTSERDGASVIEYRQRKRLSGQGTQYVNSVLPLPEHCAATRSCSVVAVETLMDRADLVHHLVIQQPNSARSCKTGRGGVRFKGVVVLHTKLMWRAPVDSSWYPGTPCVLMQAHYDNPNGSTTVDDSGVRLHISSRPRALVARSIRLNIRSINIPPQQERFFLTSTSSVDVDPATRVDNVYTHAHLLAREYYMLIWRDGKAHHVFKDANWSFGRPFNNTVPPSERNIRLRSGDVLQHTCVYNSSTRTATTRYGPNTDDEMCLAYFDYSVPRNASDLVRTQGAIWTGPLAPGVDVSTAVGPTPPA
mmetsp:Transcript_27438/g.82664  ORF Transcript_27438/g.82664 Transcript_27438/m.82664 type:complete len:346 (+) Transcript_27438:299-1336(+)